MAGLNTIAAHQSSLPTSNKVQRLIRIAQNLNYCASVS